MALSHRPLPRLPKSEGRGAGESDGAAGHSPRAFSAGFKGAPCLPAPALFAPCRANRPPVTKQIMGVKSRTFDIPSASLANGTAGAGDKSYRVKLTDKEKKRVEGLIRNAKSLQEITRLEKELNDGRIPQGGGDDMEE